MYEERNPTKAWLLGGGGVASAALLVAIFFLKASKPEIVPAPTRFAAYSAADKSFVCESPDGWAKQGSAAHGIMSGALFKNGPASINITSDLMGSLMGDMAAAGSGIAGSVPAGMENLVPGMEQALKEARKPPVEKVHEMGKKRIAGEFKTYEEQPAKPFPSKIGDARYSEFTADGGWRVGKVRGYRVTMLGGERSVTVICQCPEENWPTLQKSFARVIGSIAPGRG